MRNYTTLPYIEQVMQGSTDLNEWVLHPAGSSERIAWQDDAGMSIDNSILKLRETVKSFTGDGCLKINRTGKRSNGNILTYYIKLGDPSVQPVNAPTQSPVVTSFDQMTLLKENMDLKLEIFKMQFSQNNDVKTDLERLKVQAELIGTAKEFMSKAFPTNNSNRMAIGNTNTPDQTATGKNYTPQMTDTAKEEYKLRINTAIKRLTVHVPDIADAFEKLADLADEKPDYFKMLLANL